MKTGLSGNDGGSFVDRNGDGGSRCSSNQNNGQKLNVEKDISNINSGEKIVAPLVDHMLHFEASQDAVAAVGGGVAVTSPSVSSDQKLSIMSDSDYGGGIVPTKTNGLSLDRWKSGMGVDMDLDMGMEIGVRLDMGGTNVDVDMDINMDREREQQLVQNCSVAPLHSLDHDGIGGTGELTLPNQAQVRSGLQPIEQPAFVHEKGILDHNINHNLVDLKLSASMYKYDQRNSHNIDDDAFAEGQNTHGIFYNRLHHHDQQQEEQQRQQQNHHDHTDHNSHIITPISTLSPFSALSPLHTNGNNHPHHHIHHPHHPLILPSKNTSSVSTHLSREVIGSDNDPNDVNDEDDLGNDENHNPIPPPPEPTTAREQLIERERRSRLERERARLKRQLALSREREEEEQAFAAVDVARIGSDDDGIGVDDDDDDDDGRRRRLRGSRGDISLISNSISIRSMVSSDDGSGEDGNGNAGDMHPQNSDIGNNGAGDRSRVTDGPTDSSSTNHSPLGFTMERFLSDGVVVLESAAAGVAGGSREEDQQEDRDITNNASISSVAMNMGMGMGMGTDMDMEMVGDYHADSVSTPQHQELMDHHPDQQHLARLNTLHMPLLSTDQTNSDNLIRDGILNHHHHHHNGGNLEGLISSTNREIGLGRTIGGELGGVSIVATGPEPSSEISSPGISRINSSEGMGGGVSVGMVGGTGGLVAGLGIGGPIHHPHHPYHSESTPHSNLNHEPRLAQLTEAEISEMAEIDYASVGNMPPQSVRDDENQDLLASFPDVSGGSSGLDGIRGMGTFSQATQTTLQESVSVTSDGCGSSSEMIVRKGSLLGDEGKCEEVGGEMNVLQQTDIGTARVMDVMDSCITRRESLSPGRAHNSVICCDGGGYDPRLSSPTEPAVINGQLKRGDDIDNGIDQQSHMEQVAKALRTIGGETKDDGLMQLKDPDGMLSTTPSSTGSYKLPNRTMRPGMIHVDTSTKHNGNPFKADKLFQTVSTISNQVDDFDFCKYTNASIPMKSPDFDKSFESPSLSPSPEIDADKKLPAVIIPSDSVSNHHQEDNCTDGGPSAIGMTNNVITVNNDERCNQGNISRSYGTVGPQSITLMTSVPKSKSDIADDSGETKPLIDQPTHMVEDQSCFENCCDGNDVVGCTFNVVRSLSTDDVQVEIDACKKYISSSLFARAFSERFVILMGTLIVEIPVLLMISGGSDRLCALIGQDRYQLLMAFLPLSNAISSNCGLQSNTLATRGISHLHVTRENFWKWLLMEVTVTSILGLGIGLVLGVIAYYASGLDFSFGFVIFTANLFSIVIAGLTGTLMPLVVSSVIHHDLEKWCGFLQNVIQDIVGTFFMVITSFQLMILLS